mgnify:CR=1 FL=1
MLFRSAAPVATISTARIDRQKWLVFMLRTPGFLCNDRPFRFLRIVPRPGAGQSMAKQYRSPALPVDASLASLQPTDGCAAFQGEIGAVPARS